MRKKWFIASSLFLLIPVAVMLFIMLKKPGMQRYTNTEHGISLNFPKNLRTSKFSDESGQVKQILKLTR